MAGRSRCPVCNRFGSNKLDGYCKAHYTGKKDDDGGEKHILDDFHEKAEISGSFFSPEFGILKDGFGIEEK